MRKRWFCFGYFAAVVTFTAIGAYQEHKNTGSVWGPWHNSELDNQ